MELSRIEFQLIDDGKIQLNGGIASGMSEVRRNIFAYIIHVERKVKLIYFIYMLLSLQSVLDYCIAYGCFDDWEVVAKACICFNNQSWIKATNELKEYDSKFDSDNSGATNSKYSKDETIHLQRYYHFRYV